MSAVPNSPTGRYLRTRPSSWTSAGLRAMVSWPRSWP